MEWELLDRYLLGACSLAERARVEQWLKESPARRKLLEQLTMADEARATASPADKAAVWARLRQELDSGLKLSGDDA